MSRPYAWIDDPDALAAACATWREREAVALDTEFVRERTYYPQLGLLQVADAEGVALIDPLPMGEAGLTPFRELLADPRVEKVIHSCSEDQEVFYRAFGLVAAPVFDTQIAAAFVGHGPSLGYGGLVAALEGVELPKGSARTNWLKRPLSPTQRTYAAEDVAYLLPMRARLLRALEEKDRLGWAREEFARVEEVDRFEQPPAMAYARFKGLHRFRPRELSALQALAAWREETARERDKPRPFVLKDAVLVELSRKRPRTLEELKRLSAIRPPDVRRHGPAILQAIRQGEECPREAWPAVPDAPLEDDVARDRLERIRDALRVRAEALGLPPEVIASKRLLTRVLQDESAWPAEADGWRRPLIEEAMQSAAAPTEDPGASG